MSVNVWTLRRWGNQTRGCGQQKAPPTEMAARDLCGYGLHGREFIYSAADAIEKSASLATPAMPRVNVEGSGVDVAVTTNGYYGCV